MMISTNRVSYLLLAILIAALLGALTNGIYRLQEAQVTLNRDQGESVAWAVFETESELRRLQGLIDKESDGTDQNRLALLHRSFTAISRRIDMLLDRIKDEGLSLPQDDAVFLEAFVGRLSAIAAMFGPGQILNREDLDRIRYQTETWESRLDVLAAQIAQLEKSRAAELRAMAGESYGYTLVSSVLVICSVFALILLLVRSLRRTEVLLKEVSDAHIEANHAQQQLRLAIESINHGFAYFDAEDRLILCNQKYREIYKLSAAAIQPGRTFEDILRHGLEQGQYSEAVGREEAWLNERLEKHSSPGGSMEQLLSNGRWVMIEEHRTPEGGTVGIRVDITDLKNARQKAEMLTEVKSKFLAIMSHEIRTPLGGIIGMLDLMRDEVLEKKTKEKLETAISSAQHLNAIVNDILDLTKLEANKLSTEEKVFKLSDWIDGSLKIIEPKAARKGLAISMRKDPAIPPYLLGDMGRLRQLAINLLDNAVKFTETGSIDFSVSLLEEQEGKAVIRTEVRDCGIGISEEQQVRLFKDFGQIEEGLARRHGGTGLGLSICRRIVENLGGRIGVESMPGEGSTFWFAVPLAVAEAPTSEERQEDPAETLASTHPGPLHRRGPILLAEDNEVNQALISTYLFRAGYQVDLASNGREALLKASQKDYEVILLDISMPEMDGLEATVAIRNLSGARGRVPIVAVTANALEGDAQRCLDAGMNDYLMKPLDRKELERSVAYWMNSGVARSPAVDSGTPPAKTEGADSDSLLDEAMIADLFANLQADIAVELLRSFLRDSQRRYGNLRQAADLSDRDTVKKEAHSMKGAAISFGAKRLAETCARLENTAKEATSSDLFEMVGDLQELLAKTEREMEQKVARRSGA